MNPTATTLEQQYPLSPKKFWKKLLMNPPSVLVCLILSTFLSFVIAMIWTTMIVSSTLSDSFYPTIWISGGLIIFVISVAISVVYLKTYIKRYYYSADADFITIKKGVFAPREIHVQYSKIQDVYVDQDIYDRMLGLYDVHIASATSGSAMEAHIDGVNAASAEGLKNLFLNSIRTKGVVASVGNVQPISVAVEPVKVNLTETFSSATYPIASRWIYANFFQRIFIFVLQVLVLSVAFFGPGRGGGQNFAQLLGFEAYAMSIIIFICIAGLIIQFIYSIIWKNNYKFEFTPEYIFTHEGVISSKEAHTPYGTVQDVIVSQGIVDRIFGLYTVTIQNAANNNMVGNRLQNNGIKIVGQSLEGANKISNFLKSVLASRGAGQGNGL